LEFIKSARRKLVNSGKVEFSEFLFEIVKPGDAGQVVAVANVQCFELP